MKLLVKTLFGLEDILADELRELGAENIKPIKRAVACEGNLALMYSANYNLRTALRVLTPVHQFQARSEQELYDQVRAFDWSDILNTHQTFAIDNSVFSDVFRHSKFATLRMKDAIADQFRDKYDRRPSVDPKAPDVQFDLHGWKDRFTISLDSSGESLNQRGYRGKGHEAPLNEVLAAGMLQLAGWDKSKPLIDPMCGTGTLLIEAAMMGCNIPPQILRRNFGFRNWQDFNPTIWNRVKLDSDAKIRKAPLEIAGGDRDARAVGMANGSIRKLELREQVKVREIEFEVHKPLWESGMVITNPPYGERIGEGDMAVFYKTISDLLKQNYQNYEAWVLSSNIKALRSIRLAPSKKINLFNGALECKFQQYKLYAGSRKEA